jgi:uncharacterized repeat protein (TIGR03803 family)
LQRRPFVSSALFLGVGLAAQAFSQPIAPPFEVLHSFDSPPVQPLGGLIEGPGGLYGASQGGHFRKGAIFRLVLPTATTSAAIEKVYSFTDADFNAGLSGALGTPLLASDADFYGVGGRGVSNVGGGWLFRISATGDRTVLHRLTGEDGWALDYLYYGQGPLIEIGDWLYGTLYGGGPGIPEGGGTVFRIGRADGTFQVLHGFVGSDGRGPAAGLVHRDGWLYGTTISGGLNGGGTLFRVSVDGTAFETLRHFTPATDGASPIGELVLGLNGQLYGALRVGPAPPHGCGTIYSFDPDSSGPGAFALLASFACNGTQGSNPEGGMVVVENEDGSQALFGLAPASNNPGNRTIFRLSLGVQPTLTVLATLANTEHCSGRLLRASDGLIYGQCFGRSGSDAGRVFRIDPATGSVSTIARFGVDDPRGNTPYALIEDKDGQLYGTTRKGGPANRGTVFRSTPGAELETLHAFTDSSTAYESTDWNTPVELGATFLTHASDGLIYGTRCDGGVNGMGSIFSLDPVQGVYATLYSAGSGYDDRTVCPHGPLVESPTSPGTFFGTATGSGNYTGSVFRFLSATSEVSPLWTYVPGLSYYSEPVGRVVIGPDGLIYAAYTEWSWAFWSRVGGGVVQALPEGGVSENRVFSYYEASSPVSGLVQGPSTLTGGLVLYGTAVRGGQYGWGSVYKVSVGAPAHSPAISVLHSFTGSSYGGGADGERPRAELTRGPDGLYYGTTPAGGQHGYGTLFAIGADEQLITIHHFDHASGAYPETELVAGSDGNLYGAAPGGGPGGGGVLFRVNLAPTVVVAGPATANEGDTVTLTANGGDPQGAPLEFAWDLDADGEFDDAQGASAVFTAPDGDGDYVVSVRATDTTGLVAEARATIAVANVAPTATFANTSGRILRGQTAVLAFDSPTDPSAADTAAGFLYSFDCDGDSSFEVTPSPTPSHACSFAVSGTFMAGGRIEDKDGGVTDYTAVVEVLSPRQGIDLLIQMVKDLAAAGALEPKPARRLLHKLERAAKRLDKGQPRHAINKLRSFIRRVEYLVGSGQLSPASGQALITLAGQIITALGG